MSDAAGWLEGYEQGKPLQLQLAEAGYDVWLGNNRGSEYSQKHTKLTADQPEFWEYSWAEMGIYDDTAIVRAIKKHTGANKLFYVGWSQGTIQMFYALAHLDKKFFSHNLYKFVAFAPCTMFSEDQGPESMYAETLYKFPSLGVHDLYGPHWKQSHEKICSRFGKDTCDMWTCPDCQPSSVRNEMHWLQNTYTGRFQEYAPRYLEGEREADLIDLASIEQVPISMLVGSEDTLCTPQQAEDTAETIGDAVMHFEIIQGFDHVTFGTANDQKFINLVIS